jgi:hypothetical protein
MIDVNKIITAADKAAAQIVADKDQTISELATTDKDMARLSEDIFDYLSANDVNFLPAMSQEIKDKVLSRKDIRARL